MENQNPAQVPPTETIPQNPTSPNPSFVHEYPKPENPHHYGHHFIPSKLMILILIILVFLVGGSGLYLALKAKPSQKACTQEAKICPDGTSVGRTGPECEFSPCLNNKPTPTPSPTEASAKAGDPTASWKTYVNAEYGYSIKYPSALIFSTSSYQGIGGSVTMDTWASQDKSYSINTYSYKSGVNSKLGFSLQPQPTQTIQLANQTINKVVSVDETLTQVGPIKNGDNEYMIVYTSGTHKNIEGLSLFGQFLSTFKFTQ